ncbi:DUF2721 domain-containing protein [Roseomonas terrae]|uniref:DUF2721 domain-containing protein n=1 Tax=Neoroseomonas terrae TaxID=424799 RepID=A0ABS5EQ08_9PROT|nr:DUF2721 domain-containing protein [Neoroseomonas terrae]MBR0653115.1 DUF2721 domain-containing protein [Neoroseomonas terrae]
MLTGHDLLSIERALQLAIAPAFLLSGVFSLLTLLTARLNRLAEIRDEMERAGSAPPAQRRQIKRRARLIYNAIACAIVTAVLLCLLVIAGFLEPLAGVTAGLHVASLLVAAMLMLTASVTFFLCEVLVSRHGLRLYADD